MSDIKLYCEISPTCQRCYYNKAVISFRDRILCETCLGRLLKLGEEAAAKDASFIAELEAEHAKLEEKKTRGKGK